MKTENAAKPDSVFRLRLQDSPPITSLPPIPQQEPFSQVLMNTEQEFFTVMLVYPHAPNPGSRVKIAPTILEP